MARQGETNLQALPVVDRVVLPGAVPWIVVGVRAGFPLEKTAKGKGDDGDS